MSGLDVEFPGETGETGGRTDESAGGGGGGDGGDPASDDEPDDDDETTPAELFGQKLGLPLAAVALALAFVGPAPILELFRYELPMIASFRDSAGYGYLAWVGGATAVLGFAGGVAFRAVTDVDQVEYESDLAEGLVIPTVVLGVLMAALGYLVPLLYYVGTVQLARAGGIVIGIVIVAVVLALFSFLVMIALIVLAIPLWVPAYAGVYAGSYARKGYLALTGGGDRA